MTRTYAGLALVACLGALGACKSSSPDATVKDDFAPTAGSAFVAALQNVSCVKFASEDKNSSMPGGGKATGTFTVAVKSSSTASACADDLRAAIPGIQLGNISDTLSTITGITQPVAASDAFVQTLQAVDCVKSADADVDSHMPGGGHPTGTYTILVKSSYTATDCAAQLRSSVAGIQMETISDLNSSITGVTQSATTASDTFLQSLQAVGCVRLASADVDSHMPGGNHPTGTYSVAVKDGTTATSCAAEIQSAIAGAQIGSANDDLGTVLGIKPAA